MGKWIDARGVAARRQLHEAELSAIRSLSQKLGVESYVLACFEARGELCEIRGCRDYGLQRLRG
jgi:hypothetical protein